MNGISFNQISPYLKYITVGIIGLIINEFILIVLHGTLGVWLPLAAVCAGEIGIICQFLLNDNWVFGKTKAKLSLWVRFITYNSVSIVAVLINTAVLTGLVTFFGIDYRIANVMAVFVGFVWNVWINFTVTWKKK